MANKKIPDFAVLAFAKKAIDRCAGNIPKYIFSEMEGDYNLLCDYWNLVAGRFYSARSPTKKGMRKLRDEIDREIEGMLRFAASPGSPR
jgi:hypothetical protein